MSIVKRWPIIRHVRFLWLTWQFEMWWSRVGRHLGAVRNPSDEEYLRMVRSGDA